MTDEEQERHLDDGLKAVKAQSYHIKNAIDQNNMRRCLRETSAMCLELKTSLLTPKSYYNLYTVVFDEMQYVYNFFKEEARRGRRMKDLYDTVQQASNIIPRLYLMITCGAVYVENFPKMSKDILYDLLNMVKGVQNPTRGLFTRYYLLKMMKDKLPDKGNEYLTEKATIEDTLHFILQNLEEMNRLWIRLSMGTIGNERLLKEKERSELRILVGENIVRLSSLDGLNLEMYQNEILPKIIKILLESKDQLSQQYLMECIIQAFPDEYNIHCMSTILETSTQLNQAVDVKSLFISLMDKLAKFVGDSDKDQNEILEASEKIFGLLKSNIDTLIEQGCNQPGGITDPLKLIELLLAFMKFTIKCCPEKDKLVTINHIFESTKNILITYNKKLSSDGINLLKNLLISPLESTLSLFEFEHFPELMVYLDFSSRTSLSLRIIESLSNKEKLDNKEKVNILLGFIRPLLEDSADTIEISEDQFEYEQNIVSKMLFTISTNEPKKMFEILDAITPVFIKGGAKRIKYTLPTLVNTYIQLGYQISESYRAEESSESNNIHLEFIKYLDMTNFESDDDYEDFMFKIHEKVNNIIISLIEIYPKISFRLFSTAALQTNSIKSQNEKFSEIAKNYLEESFKIYQNTELDPSEKLSLLISFIGLLLQLRTIPGELIGQYAQQIKTIGINLVKRADQCKTMLYVSDLFYCIGNTKATEDCLNKAKRFANFAMSNPEHLPLYIHIINKYLYYIEIAKDEDYFFSKDDVDDTIELVKNHIQTIKSENTNQDFLPEAERYFEDTIKVIVKRKEENKKHIYGEIIL